MEVVCDGALAIWKEESMQSVPLLELSASRGLRYPPQAAGSMGVCDSQVNLSDGVTTEVMCLVFPGITTAVSTRPISYLQPCISPPHPMEHFPHEHRQVAATGNPR